MSEDRATFLQLRSGDDAAFERLFRKYYAPLCSFAYSYLQSREDAEETVQSVFTRLWSKRDTLPETENPRAYLYTATRNAALNKSARAKLEQRYYESADLSEEDPAPAPDESIDRNKIEDRVRLAIAELPAGCRRVLLMRWEQGLSYAEIAEALGISVKGVENQLGRARKALRSVLGSLID